MVLEVWFWPEQMGSIVKEPFLPQSLTLVNMWQTGISVL